MQDLERIARELAAALSRGGEADWRLYVPLARRVDERIGWQLLPLMVHGGGRELAAHRPLPN